MLYKAIAGSEPFSPKNMTAYFDQYKEHYRSIIRLGIPIVIGQIGIVLVGLADNIMVGQFNTLDLAAASFVNSSFNIPILFGLGFSYGLTPLVGQYFGRKNPVKVGQLLRNSLLVNLFIGILLTLIMGIFYLNIEKMGQPEELLPKIRPYFLLQLSSLIFVMLFNAFKQFCKPTQYYRELYSDLREIRMPGIGRNRSRHFHTRFPNRYAGRFYYPFSQK